MFMSICFNTLIFLHLNMYLDNQYFYTGCAHNKADIVFLLDASASEGSTNFHKQLQFVEKFVQAYDIGPNKVQVSIVTFASAPHNAFYLNTYHDKASLLQAIARVPYVSGKLCL